MVVNVWLLRKAGVRSSSPSPAQASPSKRTTPRRSTVEPSAPSNKSSITKSPATSSRAITGAKAGQGAGGKATPVKPKKSVGAPPRPKPTPKPEEPPVVIEKPVDEVTLAVSASADEPVVSGKPVKAGAGGKKKKGGAAQKAGERLISTVNEVPIRCAAVFKNTVRALADRVNDTLR